MHILQGAAQVRAVALSNDLISAATGILALRRNDDYLIVESGAGIPGKLARMAKVLSPDVAIVTLVALEHKSEFRSIDAVMREKSEIVAAVRSGGFAVLNADDAFVMQMVSYTSQRIVKFGMRENADYQAVDIKARFPERLSLIMRYGQSSLPLSTNFVGEQFWLPAIAAAATSIELGVPEQVIVERISTFGPVFGRCNLIDIPSGPQFILDTTKAPWHSLSLSFDIVEKALTSRKRIVLGHMSDFAGSDSKYRDAYHMARAIADEVIFVGNHSHRSKASSEDRESGRFREFSSPKLVADYIRSTAVPGELILLKGSVDLHLERIALSFEDHVACWEPACGKKGDCKRCGLYKISYDEHRGCKPTWRTKVFGQKRDKRAAKNSSADAM